MGTVFVEALENATLVSSTPRERMCLPIYFRIPKRSTDFPKGNLSN